MDFSSAAHELYGVPPAEFVGTRTRLVREAREAGDAGLAKRLAELRRPALPAWAVNLLSRSAGDELGWLLDAGAEMRAAWASGGSIGGLEQRRGELVALLVRTAGRLAAERGNPLRDQAVREVEDTLQAATVDAAVADEVREGRLARSRSHTGFVPAGFPVEPATADRPEARPARSDSGKVPAAAKKPAGGRKKATPPERDEVAARRSRKAAAVRERAERRLAEREEAVASAREEAEGAAAEVGRLRHELDRAAARRDTATRRLERAERARDRAAEEARDVRGSR